uniref:Uncharacterized protein n=1 Tax=Meloidogyne enterolobii TaxID=390850 RepID=A0A6V7WUR9_MELEN|nr:unnamed protein product [Meloidogyne enterolobii]
MKLKTLLILSALILFFYEFCSIKAVDHSKSLGKRKAVSTSHTDQERCNCGAFLLEQLDNYLELAGIYGSVMELKYTTESLGLIGEGQTSNVYHAHWIGENTPCVALKAYYSLNGYRKELFVLEYLNGIDVSERDHIIKMLGSE